MGITLSTIHSYTPNNQASLPEKLGDSIDDWPDPAKAVYRQWVSGMHDLFSPKLGVGDPSKEGDSKERDKKAEARYCEFMKGGACKEAFTAMEDCVGVECKEIYLMMIKCMYSHSDYYHPILTVHESCDELLIKELDAFYAS